MSIDPESIRLKSGSELLASTGRVSLTRKIDVRDRTFIRLRLDLGLPPEGRRVESLLELYFYFPGALDLSGFTLSRDDFYRELHTYLSLETPDLGPEHLVDPRLPESPLFRLGAMERTLSQGGAAPEKLQDDLIEEVKVYGCLANNYLRDRAERLVASDRPLAEGARQAFHQSLVHAVGDFRDEVRRILLAYRTLFATFRTCRVRLPDRVLGALREVDEYLSHLICKVVARLVLVLQEKAMPVAVESVPGLVEILRSERNYRASSGYHPGPEIGAGDGSFLRHVELIENSVESAMFLNKGRELGMEKLGDWIGALAAGVAMSFAFVVAKFLPQGQGARFDFWVMLLVVLAYVGKDRIKDVIKRRLISDRKGWFPDLDTRLLDRQTGAVIGRTLETTRWMTASTVPPAIEKVRSHRSLTYRELRDATGETVLRYTNRITLDPAKVFQAHGRRGHVVLTMNLGFKRYLRAARPGQVELVGLAPGGDGVVRIAGHRHYLLNVIARYGLQGGPERFEKLRIFADEHGPERVETVLPPSLEAELDKIERGPTRAEWVRNGARR